MFCNCQEKLININYYLNPQSHGEMDIMLVFHRSVNARAWCSEWTKHLTVRKWQSLPRFKCKPISKLLNLYIPLAFPLASFHMWLSRPLFVQLQEWVPWLLGSNIHRHSNGKERMEWRYMIVDWKYFSEGRRQGTEKRRRTSWKIEGEVIKKKGKLKLGN